jgi:hypothetical protein
LAISICSSRAAVAGEITFDFGGTITSVSQSGATPAGGPYSVTVGQSYSGTFSYDPSTAAYSSGAGYNFFDDPASRMSITIGSTTFGESFIAQSGVPYSGQAVDYDYANSSGYENYFTTQRDSVSVNNGIQSTGSLAVFLNRESASPLGILPSSGLPTNLNLSNFSTLALMALNESVQNNQTGATLSSWSIQGNITSLALESASVPEPSSFLSLGIGASILVAGMLVRNRGWLKPRSQDRDHTDGGPLSGMAIVC